MEAKSMPSVEIVSEERIVVSRQKARELARNIGFGTVDQTRVATAVSELARNIYRFAGKGTVAIFSIQRDREGIRIVCKDDGPGIADIELAMTDGYSTVKSLGLGLPGARRLMDEFEIESEPGKGTKITITKWL